MPTVFCILWNPVICFVSIFCIKNLFLHTMQKKYFYNKDVICTKGCKTILSAKKIIYEILYPLMKIPKIDLLLDLYPYYYKAGIKQNYKAQRPNCIFIWN